MWAQSYLVEDLAHRLRQGGIDHDEILTVEVGGHRASPSAWFRTSAPMGSRAPGAAARSYKRCICARAARACTAAEAAKLSDVRSMASSNSSLARVSRSSIFSGTPSPCTAAAELPGSRSSAPPVPLPAIHGGSGGTCAYGVSATLPAPCVSCLQKHCAS